MKRRTPLATHRESGRRPRRFAAFLLASLIGTSAIAAAAGQPAAVEQLGRLFGFGWSDGYHACRESGCRPTADLPPKSYPDRFGPRRHLDGCGPIYPPGTALPRSSTALVAPAACDTADCDHAAVRDHRGESQPVQPHPVQRHPVQPPAVPRQPAEPIQAKIEPVRDQPQPTAMTAGEAIDDEAQAIPLDWLDAVDRERKAEPAPVSASEASEPTLTLESQVETPSTSEAVSADDWLLSPPDAAVDQPPARRLPMPEPNDGSVEESETEPAAMPVRIPPPPRPAPTPPPPTPGLAPESAGESLLHHPPRMRDNPFLRPTANVFGTPARVAARPADSVDAVPPPRTPAVDRSSSSSRPTKPSAEWNPVRQP